MSTEVFGVSSTASPVQSIPSATPELATIHRETPDRVQPKVSRWVQLCREFLACHRRPINVALHLVTTPLSLLGLLCLVNLVSPWVSLGLVAAYLLVLPIFVPSKTWFATAGVMSGLLVASLFVTPSWIVGLTMFVAGYMAQEAAHWLAGEPTMQSQYVGAQGWMVRLAEHTLLLLPLILVASERRRSSPLRLFVSRDAVLPTKLTLPSQQSDLKAIRDWVQHAHPSLAQSTHWWQSDLGDQAGDAFGRLSHDESIIAMIRRHHGTGYVVKPVLGMNELYVTGPPKSTSSDTVFYMPHVDGPWSVFPGARLYRCMLAASPNTEVTTHFPMCGTSYEQPVGHRLESGDAVAFDFNRELHYITRQSDPNRTEPRVNLKLHFVAYPKPLEWYGRLLDRLTTQYDIKARNLFLQTINPNGLWAKGKAMWVLAWTKIFELVVRFVGWANLAYIGLVAVASMALGDWRVFVAGTSFVHYLIYAGTLREGSGVSFGEFRRGAVLFKSIALATLFGLYFAATYPQTPPAISLTVVIVGFGLATLATSVLGVNRTYFSAELGFDPPARIRTFPYGVIPHPMIVGAMLGLTGTLLSEPFRVQWGWLVIGHLVGYLCILAQEIHTTHRRLSPTRT